jgi:ubiquitin thioesterase protein OTUB1
MAQSLAQFRGALLTRRRKGTAVDPSRTLQRPVSIDTFRKQQRTATLRKKAGELSSVLGYQSWQLVAGGGNCFYRALLYAHINHLRGEACAGREIHGLAELQEQVMLCGTSAQAVPMPGLSEAKERLIHLFTNIRAGTMSERELENEFVLPSTSERDMSTDMATVIIARQLTADYLRMREEWHVLMRAQGTSIQEFCKYSVEKVGSDAQGFAITALPLALGIVVRVVLMDKSDSNGLQVISIPDQDTDDTSPDAAAGGGNYGVHLLYGPGHYDILYPKRMETGPGGALLRSARRVVSTKAGSLSATKVELESSLVTPKKSPESVSDVPTFVPESSPEDVNVEGANPAEDENVTTTSSNVADTSGEGKGEMTNARGGRRSRYWKLKK